MFKVIDSTNSINNTTDNLFGAAWQLGAGDNLLVQSGGYILATGSSSTGVYLNAYGNSDTITVNGLVFGTSFGIYSLGQYASITITGQVSSISTGVSISNSGKLYVSSTGQVSGGEGVTIIGNSTLVNNGTVNGTSNDAVQLTAGTIYNNGLISSYADAIFYVGDGAGRINNIGTIQGDLSTYYNASASTAKLTIANAGTWAGSLNLTTGDDTVTNSGHITGSVALGNGTNTLDSRNGTIDGSIYGGTGVDTIYAAKNGGLIYGAGGRDRLFAGVGDDQFLITAFGNTATTSVIRGFDAAHDTLELYHPTFSRLKSDQDPTFAIGPAATSPTDYLFYNPTTGGVFYDVDGSGARGAYLVATLDKGLALTASNFEVIG